MNSLISILVLSLSLGTATPTVQTEQPTQEASNIIVFEQTEEEKAIEEENKRLEEERRQAEEEQKRLEEEQRRLEEEERLARGDYQYDLGSYSTKYSTNAANANRNHNIALSTEAINGVILQPGQEFSYNDVILSKRDRSNDYLSAGAISNGVLSSAIGGGICQTSSTLFNAALYSGMTITQRRNHSLKVGYVPNGADATVSWGSVDFKFRNDLPYPVKIDASTENGTLNIRFLSTGDPQLGDVQVKTRGSGTVYYLDRYINGVIDYTTKSTYSK